jgi:hypothetical protein
MADTAAPGAGAAARSMILPLPLPLALAQAQFIVIGRLRTVSRVQAPAAVVRRRTSTGRPRLLDERR